MKSWKHMWTAMHWGENPLRVTNNRKKGPLPWMSWAKVFSFLFLFFLKSPPFPVSQVKRVLFIFSGSCRQPPQDFPCESCRRLQLCSRKGSYACRSNGEVHKKGFHSGSRNLKHHSRGCTESDWRIQSSNTSLSTHWLTAASWWFLRSGH